MFGLFEKKYFLGIDLGMFSIKVVEVVMEGGKARLVNFGMADIHEDDGAGDKNTSSHEVRRQQYLKALLQKMQVHTKTASVSIPGSSGLIAVVDFPKMSAKELGEAVQFEAHKYVPINLDEVVLSWDVLRAPQKSGEGDVAEVNKNTSTVEKVLLVAALKKDVEKAANLVQQSGCRIGAMELEVFSLARALVDRNPGTHLVIDIGFRVTNLVLVHGGDVFANRTVDVGGGDITKTIADGMNISFDRAEALKKQRDFFHQNEIPLTFPAVEVIFSETRRVIASFQEQNPGSLIDSIIFSGGSSGLPGLKEHFSEQMKVPAVQGDPWRRVQYDNAKMSSSGRDELGGALAIAFGLVLRDIE